MHINLAWNSSFFTSKFKKEFTGIFAIKSTLLWNAHYLRKIHVQHVAVQHVSVVVKKRLSFCHEVLKIENYFRYKCKIGNNAINSTDGKITLHYMCHVKMLSVWETLPMLVLHALSCHECVICAILCALLQRNAWII